MDAWPVLLDVETMGKLEHEHPEMLDRFWSELQGRMVAREDQSFNFNYDAAKYVLDSVLPSDYKSEVVEIDRYREKRIVVSDVRSGGSSDGGELLIENVMDADSYCGGLLMISFKRIENENGDSRFEMQEKAKAVGRIIHDGIQAKADLLVETRNELKNQKRPSVSAGLGAFF